jgi:hypothetical protein
VIGLFASVIADFVMRIDIAHEGKNERAEAN